MRILRKHDSSLEKQADYMCIKCAGYQEKIYHGERGYEMKYPADDVRAAHELYNEMFRNFAWPGGYPVIFTIDDGSVLCAGCAKKIFILEKQDVTADIYYEGPTLQCDECGRKIESSYGDPDAEEEQEEGND